MSRFCYRGAGMYAPIRTALITAGLSLSPAAVQAQTGAMPEAEALGNCFVLKSTGEDRVALVRWFASAMLASPKTADLAQLAPGKMEQAQRQVAAIFTRLMTKDCLTEAQAVAKTSNASAGFELAGSALGKIAVRELLSDPAAEAAISGFAKYVPKEDFKKLDGK